MTDMIAQNLSTLIVDDDDASREGLRRLLEIEGFRVDVAEDGVAALRVIERGRPDVVLTDVQMPNMNGIELCARLHEIDPTLPVILITAFGDMMSAVAGLREGAADYLTKPVDFEDVRRSIGHALAARAREDAVAIVSHDLRDPLQVIHGTVSLLEQMTEKSDAEPSDPGRENDMRLVVRSLTKATARIEHLVSDILDDARLRAGTFALHRAPVRVSEVLADVLELDPLAAKKKISLEVHAGSAGDIGIQADRARLAQVFANLVSNAIKFGPERSRVSVDAEAMDGGVRFRVRDEGPGIAPEHLTNVFSRFWKPRGGAGLGLGLHIAKGIVAAHVGRIWAESPAFTGGEDGRTGGGSAFFVWLPSGAS